MMLMIEKLKAEVRALRAQLEEHGIKPNISAFKLKAEEEPAAPDEGQNAQGEEEETKGEEVADESGASDNNQDQDEQQETDSAAKATPQQEVPNEQPVEGSEPA